MDPVSMIVAALVSGIIAGLKTVGGEAVKDGYTLLKNMIFKKYGPISSIERLEQDPQSKTEQVRVEQELRSAGAEHDPEILQLAQALYDLIAPETKTSGQLANPAASPTEEIIERAERNAGNQAIKQIVDNHINGVMYVRAHYPVSDQDLLTRNIVQTRAVPSHISADIGQLHNKIRSIIQQIAFRIENRKYKTAEEAVQNMRLALADRQRAQQLVQADKSIHISYQALKTTVEFFADFNQIILEKIRRAGSTQSETDLLLGNALLVYELTDYVISYIENFVVSGIEDITRLHEETKQKIAEFRRQQEGLEQRAQSASVEEAVRNQIITDIEAREKSIDLLEQEWTGYIEMATSLRSEADKIRNKVPTLEVIRENAKVQINLIQAVAMLQILKQNIGTMRTTIITLENMRLASLSPNRVRRLLGIS